MKIGSVSGVYSTEESSERSRIGSTNPINQSGIADGFMSKAASRSITTLGQAYYLNPPKINIGKIMSSQAMKNYQHTVSSNLNQ